MMDIITDPLWLKLIHVDKRDLRGFMLDQTYGNIVCVMI